MPIQLIYKNTPVRLYATFTDPVSNSPPLDTVDDSWPGSGSNRQLVDPGTVTANIKRGDNSLFTGSPITANRLSQGKYYIDIVIDQASTVAQTWWVKFIGTTPRSSVVEYSFRVEPTHF